MPAENFSGVKDSVPSSIGSLPSEPQVNSKPENPLHEWLAIAFLGIVGLLIVWSFYASYKKARIAKDSHVCRTNLKLLAKALNRYAADHQGQFPERLETLAEFNRAKGQKRYLVALPICPSTGTMSYLDYSHSAERDNFTLGCRGHVWGMPTIDKSIWGEHD